MHCPPLTRAVCFLLVSEGVPMHLLCLNYNLYFLEKYMWNPESLKQESQDYLHLLLGLFDLLVSGASEGSDALQYRALMNLLFKVSFLHLLLWIMSQRHELFHGCITFKENWENGQWIMQHCLWYSSTVRRWKCKLQLGYLTLIKCNNRKLKLKYRTKHKCTSGGKVENNTDLQDKIKSLKFEQKVLVLSGCKKKVAL